MGEWVGCHPIPQLSKDFHEIPYRTRSVFFWVLGGSRGTGKGIHQGGVTQDRREVGAAERIPAGRDLSSRKPAEEAPKRSWALERMWEIPTCAKPEN